MHLVVVGRGRDNDARGRMAQQRWGMCRALVYRMVTVMRYARTTSLSS